MISVFFNQKMVPLMVVNLHYQSEKIMLILHVILVETQQLIEDSRGLWQRR